MKADRLTRICAALLQAASTPEDEAQAVATGCVNANLAGHDSHGVIAIPTYIDAIKADHIVPGAKWTVVQESPTTAVIDGHWGFGFHVNAKAMALTLQNGGGGFRRLVLNKPVSGLGGVDGYRSQRMMAARVTTAR